MGVAAETGEGAEVAEIAEELNLRRRVGEEGADVLAGVGSAAKLVVIEPERTNLRTELQVVVALEDGQIVDVGVGLSGVGAPTPLNELESEMSAPTLVRPPTAIRARLRSALGLEPGMPRTRM